MIPAYREKYQENGRAKGGLAQLAGRRLDIKKERIQTKSWRLQAQILHIGNYRLIWINCYFPTDPQTANYDKAELYQILTEIENILDNNSFDDCILAGDLNYDTGRATGFARALRTILEKIGLLSVWGKFSLDFTHFYCLSFLSK